MITDMGILLLLFSFVSVVQTQELIFNEQKNSSDNPSIVIQCVENVDFKTNFSK